MSKKHTWLLTIVFLGWLLMDFPQVVQAVGFEAAFGVWYAEPGGGIGYEGDSLDLKNDLNYSSEVKFFGRAKVELPRLLPNIYLMATPLSYDGTAAKNTSFTFGNQTFVAGTSFTSNVKLDHYDLALYYGVPFIKSATQGMLNVDLGFNMRVFDVQAKVTQGGNMQSESFYMPVPMIYLGIQVRPVQSLSLEGEIRGIAYNGNQFYNLIGRIKYNFFSFAFVSAGYRYEEVVFDTLDIKSDVRFSGPLLELGLQF